MKMNKMNKKYGFSLAELVVCIAILGFLLVAALATYKKYDPGTKYLVSNVLTALDRAFYNASAVDGLNIFGETYQDSAGNTQEIKHTDTEDTGAKLLCLGLTKYINTVERAEDHDGVAGTCSATKLVDYKAADTEFTDDKIQFVANNGVRFYTTKILSADSVPFYLVFADINGEKRPNTVMYAPAGKDEDGKDVRRHDPDIFAFAVLPMGRIIPIGITEIEPSYLQTRIIYIDSSNQRRFSAVSQPYYISKAVAWGYYTNEEGAPPDPNVNGGDFPDDPHTYNDYIRRKISDSLIYTNNETIPTPNKTINNGVDFELTDEEADEQDVVNMHCKIGAFDNCTINIDRYAY